MPNKTIYVSDGDLPLYQRAQELAGGNLSAAIADALRRFVDVEEGRREGFDEIIVRVGRRPGPQGPLRRRPPRRVARHVAAAASRHSASTAAGTGKFVLHVERSAESGWSTPRASRPAGAATSASAEHQLRITPGESTLEVVDTLEELRDKVPPQLFDMVARLGAASRPSKTSTSEPSAARR